MNLYVRVFNHKGGIIDRSFPATDITDIMEDPLNSSRSLLFVRETKIPQYEKLVDLRQGVAMVSDQPIQVVRKALDGCTFC